MIMIMIVARVSNILLFFFNLKFVRNNLKIYLEHKNNLKYISIITFTREFKSNSNGGSAYIFCLGRVVVS